MHRCPSVFTITLPTDTFFIFRAAIGSTLRDHMTVVARWTLNPNQTSRTKPNTNSFLLSLCVSTAGTHNTSLAYLSLCNISINNLRCSTRHKLECDTRTSSCFTTLMLSEAIWSEAKTASRSYHPWSLSFWRDKKGLLLLLLLLLFNPVSTSYHINFQLSQKSTFTMQTNWSMVQFDPDQDHLFYSD